MTAAHEAILCKEQGLPYACVCMVDNMANGIDSKELDTEEVCVYNVYMHSMESRA